MLKPGEKLICIKTVDDYGIKYPIRIGDICTFDYYRRDKFQIKHKERYIYHQISIVGNYHNYFSEDLFISLKEQRKQKLKKICSKKEIK